MRTDDFDRLGVVTAEGDGSFTVRFERVLAHPVEAVWAALTDPGQMSAWFMPGTVEGRVGGRVRLDSGEPGGTVGEVLVWEPPVLLVYSWARAGGEGAQTTVRWELQPVEGGTLLVLEHSGVDRQTAYEYPAGWHDFLDRLRGFLEGDPPEHWPSHHDELLERYRALAG